MSAIPASAPTHPPAEDDVDVAGRARWARAWDELVAAAALVLRYRCVSPAGDLWQDHEGGAPQPLSRLVHAIRRALRKGGAKRRGFELALVAAERALVLASGWALHVIDFDGVERYRRPGADAAVTLSCAAAACRAEVLREELEGIPGGPRSVPLDRPALVVDGYDQRQPEGEGERGDDAEASTPDLLDPAGSSFADSFAQAPAPSDDESLPLVPPARGPTTRALHHGGSVTPSLPGGECA